MPSKKTPKQRRASFPRAAGYAKSLIKDWDRLSRAGKLDLHRLKEMMTLIIANDGPLGAEWSDHELKGDWNGYRECHVGGDFLLIYELKIDVGVVFVRAGSHSDLFE